MLNTAQQESSAVIQLPHFIEWVHAGSGSAEARREAESLLLSSTALHFNTEPMYKQNMCQTC